MAVVTKPKLMYARYRSGLRWRARFMAAWAVAIVLAGYAHPVAMVAGQDASPGGGCRFSDVPDSSIAHADIVFACHQGWFSGYPDGSFQPDRPVPAHQITTVVGRAFATGSTRADIATFLRGGNPGDPAASAGFPDVPDTHPQGADIDYAVERSWFRGYPDGFFRPDQTITATQITTVLQRAFPTGSTRAQLAAFMRNGHQALPWTGKIAYSAPVYNSLGRVAARALRVEGVGGSVTRELSEDVELWKWSPDGNWITYSTVVRDSRGSKTGNYELWVADSDGTDPRKLTNNVRSQSDVASWGWSPDGKWITYETDDREFWVANADSTNPRLLTEAYNVVRQWSPDSEWLAYQRGAELWVVGADGTNTRLLTDKVWHRENGPRPGYWGWSPDGNWIAYETGSSDCCPLRRIRVELWVVGTDGTDARKLTDKVWHRDQWWWMRGSWEWSSDGERLAYKTDNGELWVANADSTEPRMVTDNVRGWEWSPVGKWITFYTDSRELWVASADGTYPRKITTFSRYYFSVSPITWEWSPYGDWLAYKNQDNPPGQRVIGGEWWVVGMDGTQARKLEGSPSWSQDGGLLTYTRIDDEIWVAGTDGMYTYLLTGWGWAWSPDRGKITYRRGDGELWVAAADGTNPRRLTNNVSHFVWLWSPNSEWIAYRVGVWEFGSRVGGEWWVAAADGTNPRKLGADGLSISYGGGVNARGQPSWIGLERWEWSSDGERFAYETDSGELWVAGADGTQARKLTDDVGSWEWQPVDS